MTPTTIQNCFNKCGFSSDGEYIDGSNDVLHEQEKGDWCTLKPSDTELDEYVSCIMMSGYVRQKSVDQVMHDHLT
jgi:hypothetical protein